MTLEIIILSMYLDHFNSQEGRMLLWIFLDVKKKEKKRIVLS